MRTIFYTALIFIAISSCKSIETMVEKGEYNKALDYAANKLAGEKNKKTKYVKGLEKAYAELNKRDVMRIEALLKADNLDKWENIYDVYARLERRQAIVSPLIPLVSADGYIANLSLSNYLDKKTEARDNTLSVYYHKAAELLLTADKYNDKSLAREAYDYFSKLGRFNKNYKDSETLMYHAKDLGTVHIAIDVKNDNTSTFHNVMADKISNLRLERLNSTWEEFHFMDKKKNYDKYVVIQFDAIDLGLEKEQVNNYEMSALVEDGIEYIYDHKGNIRKDSLGQKITIPRKVITKAWVSEIFRKKESSASAKVLLYNETKSLPVQNLPLKVYHNFKDSAVRFTGDKRALNMDICNKLDNYIADFPSNYDTATILSENMVNVVEEAIRKLRIV